MTTFLRRYLLTSGLLAMVALFIPYSISVGLLLFIFPGVVLIFAPTAFLWGLIFALIWLAIRRFVSADIASVVALIGLAIIVWGIPPLTMWLISSDLAHHRFSAVTANAPIRPEGDVRIDMTARFWKKPDPDVAKPQEAPWALAPFSCDSRCVGLLFEPGVRSVTINASDGLNLEQMERGLGGLLPSARTYRLLKRGQCKGGGYQLHPRILFSGFARTFAENRAIDAEWRERLAHEFCIDSQPAIQRHDLLLRSAMWRERTDAAFKISHWALMPAIMGGGYAEVRDGSGKILVRRGTTLVSALDAPWWVSLNDEDARFEWPRRTIWVGERQHPYVDGLVDNALIVRRTVRTRL